MMVIDGLTTCVENHRLTTPTLELTEAAATARVDERKAVRNIVKMIETRGRLVHCLKGEFVSGEGVWECAVERSRDNEGEELC